MTTFTAWKFETVDGAEKGDRAAAANDDVITIEDYAGHRMGDRCRSTPGHLRASRRRARRRLGTSALFVVNTCSDRDRLAERFHGIGASLIASNLVPEEEAEVRRALED